MYIKTYNKNGEQVITNFNVSDVKLIYVKGNNLVFEMPEKSFVNNKGKTETNVETNTLYLSSPEEAEKAFNALFVTLGMSAPLNNVLDLTGVMIEPSGSAGYTIPEIAKKLKVDPRKMAIVFQSNGYRTEEDENEIVEDSEKTEETVDEVE